MDRFTSFRCRGSSFFLILHQDLHVFAHHGVGGAVGMLCTALFASTAVNSDGVDGAFSGNGLVLAKALLVLLLVVLWVLLATLGCLWVTDLFLSLRVTGEAGAQWGGCVAGEAGAQ